MNVIPFQFYIFSTVCAVCKFKAFMKDYDNNKIGNKSQLKQIMKIKKNLPHISHNNNTVLGSFVGV